LILLCEIHRLVSYIQVYPFHSRNNDNN